MCEVLALGVQDTALVKEDRRVVQDVGEDHMVCDG